MSELCGMMSDFGRSMEKNYVEAPANLSGCECSDEHRLHMALSETRARPIVFTPEHKGIGEAYCATFGRRCSA
ncbi:MAG: hypothetical protein AB1646_12225 [Thermodesulfobacteriota bacterium]